MKGSLVVITYRRRIEDELKEQNPDEGINNDIATLAVVQVR